MAKKIFLANQKVYIFSYSTNRPESNTANILHTNVLVSNYELYLESAVVEVHDNGPGGAEPFLHEDGFRGRSALPSVKDVASRNEMLVHVLGEVYEEGAFLLVLPGSRLIGERVHFVAQVVVSHGAEKTKQTK